ncbi:hypothetical protein Ndes2526B_g08573 [Nannochloris sp. 'desiccata']|nr:hypothetical protein KSW81_001831 [Chlorella desiccata (nom. nud.)]KAH7616272.1 hypothetical protein NADE_001095 [Chlorella desiccata (nom. nud.)]KAH7616482.1 hypothetical protein NADE_001300 [Chlorella desiccata (nom. nud.)]
MTSSGEDDIPLAKRQKYLQQERGVQTKLPTTEPQEEKTVSPDSDYIVIDSSEDEDVIVGQPAAATASALPLRAQWLPIPLRPINYGRKSASIEKEAPPPDIAVEAQEKIEIEDEEEEEIIELSSTTEEGQDNNDDEVRYEREIETARRVEQEVILLGHGTSDDGKMREHAIKRPRAPPPPPLQMTALPSPSRQVRPSPRPPIAPIAPSGSRLNPSQRPYNNRNGNATGGPGRPLRSTDVLDTPYEFQSWEAASEFKRKFHSGGSTSGILRPSSRGYPAINQSAVDKRAKQILHEMTQVKQQAVQKSQVAWTAAALKWREKNKPSEAELKRRAQEDSARASEAARRRAKITPMAHSARAAESEGGRNNRGGGGRGNYNNTSIGGVINDKDDPPPPRPAANAPELERRSYYRNIAQRKVAHASSFAQVLNLLGVPCDDPLQIKYSYRIAVRMFHPDSNSKEKVWNTPEEKVQAEEVMKIINERKERDY